MDVKEYVAFEAIKRAGVYLRKDFSRKASGRKEITVSDKNLLDLVSSADRNSEHIIISSIIGRFHGDGILAEESEEIKGSSGYRWIIDPLEGTHSFLFGFREFGCSLALEKDGEIIFAICYFPMYEELFWAKRGEGAFCNNKRIRVSTSEELRGHMYFPDSALRHVCEEALEDIRRFIAVGCRLRVFGSLQFSLTRIARGQGIAATNRAFGPWDIAPAALVLEEAGGSVTDEKGSPWRIDSRVILATNKIAHPKALAIFQQGRGL